MKASDTSDPIARRYRAERNRQRGLKLDTLAPQISAHGSCASRRAAYLHRLLSLSLSLSLSLRADNSWPSSTLLISGATFPDHRVGNFGFRLVVPAKPPGSRDRSSFRLCPPSATSSSSSTLQPFWFTEPPPRHEPFRKARRAMLFRPPIYVADGCFEFNPA